MSEAAAHLEPKNNSEYHQAAVMISKELIRSQSYAKLSEADLRSSGLIANEESTADFIAREMQFGESLQYDALKMFCNEAPPPIDTAEVNHWEGHEIIPQYEEDDVRLKCLGAREDSSSTVEHLKPAGLKRLVNGIVTSAEVLEWDNDSTADPVPLRKNIDSLMKLLNSDPEVMTLNGQRCWAIRLPKKYHNVGEESFPDVITPPHALGEHTAPGDYIVVSDPDRNAELSSLVFSDKELLGHMIKKNLGSVQSQVQTELDYTLRHVAYEKYIKAQDKVNSVNDEARVSFFDRLSHDSEKGEIELISIFRDQKDIAVFEGERPYNPNRAGSLSSERRFTVTKGENGELLFSWNVLELKMTTVLKDGQRTRQPIRTPKKVSARVKSNGSRLEYAELVGGENPSEWSDKYDYKSENASTVRTLFRNIELITVNEWLEHGNDKSEAVAQVMKTLSACSSSVEYANKLRELGVANYPTAEIIVNPGKKVNYVVDSTTQPPTSRVSLN